MAFQRHMNIFFFFLLFSCFLFSSQASKFYVGGRDGWVLHPSENYTHWTQKNRFQINDTLVFKYKKGSDSVLLVNKDDYYNCSTKNPIKKLEEGDSEYKLDKSGPFFFISGKEQNCEKGQKLIVTVLSVKHSNTSHPPKTPTAPTQAPTPSSSHTPKVPPSLAPSSSSPGPSIATSPISQGPVTTTPATSPSFSPLISPSSSSPSPSFSPLISPPSSSPSFSPSFSPSSLSPASAPSASPGPAPSSYGPASEAPSPESNAPTESPASYSSPPQPETPSSPPSLSPSPSSSSTPSSQSPTSPSPGSGNPNATPPAQSSVWAVTPTHVLVNLVGSVTILLSVSLGPVF
ncbi:hypothetical protein RGQ29_027358 [Quercus rubra]|uniref:Phytocyanin domain-containing protein n=1 Tax=Quercus rubra TaxID=3512 RepID=A0AAN7IDK4_QUERU|nr:hypothetical protein RGQ29_027358 [Quercus rubra]